MTRVAIVAESARLRSELSDLLRQDGRFEVIASVGSLDAFLVDEVDVVLVEGMGASAAAKMLEDTHVGLVLLADDEELRPLRGGVALLPAAAGSQQIGAAVEGAAAGLLVMHLDHVRELAAAPAEDPLTPREREVLYMLAAGLGNKEIAARLHISDHTAKFHVSQILGKLNAATRAEAVSIGMRRGLVPL
jgi:two-component system, NarL family, response regulator YdfI